MWEWIAIVGLYAFALVLVVRRNLHTCDECGHPEWQHGDCDLTGHFCRHKECTQSTGGCLRFVEKGGER